MRKSIAALSLLLSFLVASSAAYTQPAASPTTSIINAGQGDSASIQDGNGVYDLIGGGVGSAGLTVTQFLHDHGATDLDLMSASHVDAVHLGGLISVLRNLSITTQAIPSTGYPGSTATWNVLIAAANDRMRAVSHPFDLFRPGAFRLIIAWA